MHLHYLKGQFPTTIYVFSLCLSMYAALKDSSFHLHVTKWADQQVLGNLTEFTLPQFTLNLIQNFQIHLLCPMLKRQVQENVCTESQT